ncbi:unnamed protein product [Schistosoma margrebowiei]|uniref:FGFR1 oncogene partner (FOP) N-terminal dimerisation domain-containing protein n=1 Tax=Schistosoma margrebowiei TaxID=48269 RepID=A0AA84ZBV2_9TREM|nr:unnamed protein product [Schistosoma margrebowiei]
MEMNSNDDLKNHLKKALNDDGFLNELKTDILKKIFQKIRNQSPELKTSSTSDTYSNIKLLINELIIEYLNFENLSFTESVFRQESGHGNLHNLPRQFLCQTLQIKPTVNIKSLNLKNHHHNNNSNADNPLNNQKSSTELIEQPIPLLFYIVHYLMVNGLDRVHNHELCNKDFSSQEQKSITNGWSLNNRNNEDDYNHTCLQTTQKHFHPDHILIHEPTDNTNWINSESDLY